MNAKRRKECELSFACALALGKFKEKERKQFFQLWKLGSMFYLYDPLHDDREAMGLVKRFCLMVHTYTSGKYKGLWRVTTAKTEASNRDLNRAIVECVAKLGGKRK